MRNAHRPPASSEAGSPEQLTNPRRRGFLLSAGIGAIGSAAGTAAVARTVAPPVAAAEPDAKRGYQETEHVRDYYRTARL